MRLMNPSPAAALICGKSGSADGQPRDEWKVSLVPLYVVAVAWLP